MAGERDDVMTNDPVCHESLSWTRNRDSACTICRDCAWAISGLSGRMRSKPDTALPWGSPHVLHESRQKCVAIVAISRVSALLLGQAIAHRTALALGDNQVSSQQMLQITLQCALGCPIREEREHLAR